MTKFRDGLIGPTLILFTICFVITLALAQVYVITKPIIDEGERVASNEARMEVLPEGKGFAEITGAALPEGVSEAYKADNGAGYVFTSEAKGFGGPVVYMIGIDNGGNVVGLKMFSHDETPGLGTKVGDMGYLQNYYGSVDVDVVDAVTGATRTTESLKNSLKQAYAAFELVKEV